MISLRQCAKQEVRDGVRVCLIVHLWLTCVSSAEGLKRERPVGKPKAVRVAGNTVAARKKARADIIVTAKKRKAQD